MEKIKTIQEYVFQDQSTKEHAGKEFKNETSPLQTKMGKTMIKHSPVDDREDTDQPEDTVIQPDLPPMLEEDSMNESMHEIEDDFDNEADDDNTAHSLYRM